MKTLIIFDSYFGNTEMIASAMGDALRRRGEVETLRAVNFTVSSLNGADALIVGSPTRGFRPSDATLKLLDEITDGRLAGVKVAAFDTRIQLETIKSRLFRFVVDKGGYAAKAIGEALVQKGGVQAAAPEGFLVAGEQGPLLEGELQRAAEWAARLLP